jgi:osmotically inducible protein OsmC
VIAWKCGAAAVKLLCPRSKVTCQVSIGPRDAGGVGIAVKMHVADHSMPTAELKKYVDEAHEKIRPNSHATRGNIPFELTVEGA